MPSHRTQLEQEIASLRAERVQWMAVLPEDLRRLLPLDATPLTRGIELLGDAVGIGERLRGEQRERSHANSAVLHGRVFGRGAELSQDTALAAFADGARVRDELLAELAEAIDGMQLRREVEALLHEAPALSPDGSAAERTEALEAAFAIQERALLLCAERLDAVG